MRSPLHTVYFYALGASYGAGDFSRVYPIARGLGVALVPVAAYAIFGEGLSPLGVLGIALVLTGIVAINLSALLGSLWLGEGRLARVLRDPEVLAQAMNCRSVW